MSSFDWLTLTIETTISVIIPNQSRFQYLLHHYPTYFLYLSSTSLSRFYVHILIYTYLYYNTYKNIFYVHTFTKISFMYHIILACFCKLSYLLLTCDDQNLEMDFHVGTNALETKDNVLHLMAELFCVFFFLLTNFVGVWKNIIFFLTGKKYYIPELDLISFRYPHNQITKAYCCPI